MGDETKRNAEIMTDTPPMPKKYCPLHCRINGDRRDAAFWAGLADEADLSNRPGDAYYYWLEAANTTRNSDESKEYKSNAQDSLDIWCYNNS